MQDILLDENFKVKIVNGDIAVGESDRQQQELLLVCNKGSFKQKPATCVGLWNYLEAEDPAAMLAEIKSQFKADGMEVKIAGFVDGKLAIEAYYK